MIAFPNAKINIGLHVISQRADGYHHLETVFYPVQLTDALEMAESSEPKLTLSGIPVNEPAGNNLVLKAWRFLKDDFDIPPVQFHLHKMIPPGAGLGGGSSDAAFTLKMLNDYFGLSLNAEQLKGYATKIGADCSFFIENKPAFATGIGDRLHSLKIDLSGFQVVILKPECSVSTREAFKNVHPAPPAFNLKKIETLPVEQWKNVVVNDFEKSVFPLYPIIEKSKKNLYQLGALYASMSGSGSAVFGIFRHLPANFSKKITEGTLMYR